MLCRGYVRYLGLSVDQPMHIQGCGDYNIDRIEAAEEPCSSGRSRSAAHAVQSMDMAGSGATVLAVADPAKRQGTVRLNVPDPLAGEQTWPTEEVSVAAICLLVVMCWPGMYGWSRKDSRCCAADLESQQARNGILGITK